MTDALSTTANQAAPGRSFDHEAGHGRRHHRPLRRVVRLRHLRVCGDHTGGGVLCLLGSDRGAACRVRHLRGCVLRPSTRWSLLRFARRQDWPAALPCRGRGVDVVVHLLPLVCFRATPRWVWRPPSFFSRPGSFRDSLPAERLPVPPRSSTSTPRPTSVACCRVCYPPLPRRGCCLAQY